MHDFEDLYLMWLKASTIAIYEETEKVQKLAFVVAIIWLFLYVLANLFDKLKDFHLVIKHCFIVIVHLLEKIDAANVLTDMLEHFWDVRLHQYLDLVEVFNECHNEIVAHMKKFNT